MGLGGGAGPASLGGVRCSYRVWAVFRGTVTVPSAHSVAAQREGYIAVTSCHSRYAPERAGGAAVAVPSIAAILAACSKPTEGAGGGGSTGTEAIPIATLENPVTLPVTEDPIAAETPIESGPLVLYNWADYLWKKKVNDFDEE